MVKAYAIASPHFPGDTPHKTGHSLLVKFNNTLNRQ
jgi:hypothetical protein